MSERGFRFLEHTADVLVEAWGPSLEAAFEEMARGMIEIMTDTSKIEPRERKEIEVCGFDLENLLYSCLLYTSPSPRDLSTSRMPSSA